MSRRAATLLLSVLLSLAGSGCDRASDARSPEPQSSVRCVLERGPVRWTLEADPAHARLSDQVTLTLTTDVESGVEVTPVALGESCGEFDVRDAHTSLPRVQSGRNIREQRWVLEPRQAGTWQIPAISLRFHDRRAGGDGLEHTVDSEPLTVEVRSDLADGTPALSQARPPAPPVGLPQALRWRELIFGAVALLAAALGVAWLRRRRAARAPAPPPPPSPRELARRALAALLADRLAERDIKAFYLALTQIVRQYLEATTGIRAPEQTTEEFLHAIRNRNDLPIDLRQSLRDFLESADLVKFAGHRPRPGDVEESARRARAFLELEPAHVTVAAGAVTP